MTLSVRIRPFERRDPGSRGIDLVNILLDCWTHRYVVVRLQGSFGAIVAINTDEEFPQQCRIFPETHVRGTKRKRSQSVTEHRDGDQPSGKSSTCTMCLRYNSMLFMDFVADHELVVVEQPWLNVVATFPDALHRRVYGT